MKLRALANLSGPSLKVEKGEDFEVPDEKAQELIERKVAEQVDGKPAAKRKPAEGE
ncbi:MULTISPECIES: hypothetical protein [unclassified Pseudomonas]|uniref:hypothetical protein n=1 Tax=unclassified Pseudomonas TaxID=196821 RepID=UPI0025DEC2C7|nr:MULTISPECIES: hypothetical protein [unclassified Pseudomonas]